jgi:mevalonate kinase
MKAHGKFILLGEHSILYGGSALAFPITEISLTVSLKADSDGTRLNGAPLKDWQEEKISEVFSNMQLPREEARLDIQSEIPVGKGLGSSASLCVALAKFFFPKETAIESAQRALLGERVFHGTPSGVDPWTISLNQPILFQMEASNYRPLNLSNAAGYAFLLRDSGSVHRTEHVIANVQKLKREQPQHFLAVIERLKTNTTLGLKLLEDGEMERLGLLLQDSNRSLFEMGLGTPEAEEALESLLIEGALGAKITGAGCGGYVLGLFPEHKFPKKIRPSDIIVRCF